MDALALVTEAYGGTGGIARANRDVLEGFVACGVRPFVLPRLGHAAARPEGMRVAPSRRSKWAYSAAALWAARRQGPFDFIFCGHLFMAPLAAYLSRRVGVPYWLHLHGIEAWTAPRPAVVNAAGQAALVTCVSRYTRRRFLSWSTIGPEKARVLPNTFDARFAAGPKPAQLMKSLAVQGRPVILTVGRLSSTERYKGHDRVIGVLKHFSNEVVYVIAGDGDDRPRLEGLAKKEGVGDRVLFLGAVDEAQLPDVYRLADVFVMPSSGEGFGIVFVEAMASGIPVIGGNADGSWDALCEGRLGAAIDVQSEKQLRESILQALNAPRAAAYKDIPFKKESFRAHMKALLTCALFQTGKEVRHGGL